MWVREGAQEKGERGSRSGACEPMATSPKQAPPGRRGQWGTVAELMKQLQSSLGLKKKSWRSQVRGLVRRLGPVFLHLEVQVGRHGKRGGIASFRLAGALLCCQPRSSPHRCSPTNLQGDERKKARQEEAPSIS